MLYEVHVSRLDHEMISVATFVKILVRSKLRPDVLLAGAESYEESFP